MSFAVNHLTKKFGPKTVLQDFSLTVNGPLVLMGPSGCGKTTLLRILMGLETADEGAVQAPVQVAAVFQENRLCPQLTAAANITLPGGSATAAEAELRALGFTDKELALPCAKLSGGQARRAALLRALLCPGAPALLFDEPFTGMDAALVSQASAAIRRLTAGRDAILVTHDAEAASSLGWPVVRMYPAEAGAP